MRGLPTFYCASVSFCDPVSSSDGGAGRGRHQDLIQGEARRERHSSGEALLSHTAPEESRHRTTFLKHFGIHLASNDKDQTRSFN